MPRVHGGADGHRRARDGGARQLPDQPRVARSRAARAFARIVRRGAAPLRGARHALPRVAPGQLHGRSRERASRATPKRSARRSSACPGASTLLLETTAGSGTVARRDLRGAGDAHRGRASAVIARASGSASTRPTSSRRATTCERLRRRLGALRAICSGMRPPSHDAPQRLEDAARLDAATATS